MSRQRKKAKLLEHERKKCRGDLQEKQHFLASNSNWKETSSHCVHFYVCGFILNNAFRSLVILIHATFSSCLPSQSSQIFLRCTHWSGTSYVIWTCILPRRTSSSRRCLEAPLKILIQRKKKQKFEIQIQILWNIFDSKHWEKFINLKV